jgi:hypothetical protein
MWYLDHRFWTKQKRPPHHHSENTHGNLVDESFLRHRDGRPQGMYPFLLKGEADRYVCVFILVHLAIVNHSLDISFEAGAWRSFFWGNKFLGKFLVFILVLLPSQLKYTIPIHHQLSDWCWDEQCLDFIMRIVTLNRMVQVVQKLNQCAHALWIVSNDPQETWKKSGSPSTAPILPIRLPDQQ